MSVWTLGTLVVGALLGSVVGGQWSALAAREAGSPASAAQRTGPKGEYVTPARMQAEGYFIPEETWSSKAVADECAAMTETDYTVPAGSPKYKEIPFLPVNGKGGEDIAGPYEPVIPWPQPLHGGTMNDWDFGAEGGLYVQSPDRVYVLQRSEDPPIKGRGAQKAGYVWGSDVVGTYVKASSRRLGFRKEHHLMIFNRQGKLIDWWKQWESLWANTTPSRIHVSRYDPERHIWTIDGEKILKFTNDGKKIVMKLENKDPSGKPIGFHGGMAWLPNGDFFVLGTNRIAKYSKEGKFLSEFGSHGSGPGQFGGGLQGLVLHPDTRRLYVGDRPNARMQIFDENGKFLDQWPNIMAIYVLRLTKDNHMWVADSMTHKYLKYDLNGKLLTSWGTFGIAAGAIYGVHYFDVDNEGALYSVSDYSSRHGAIQKLVPRKDVDPKDPRLIGPLVQ